MNPNRTGRPKPTTYQAGSDGCCYCYLPNLGWNQWTPRAGTRSNVSVSMCTRVNLIARWARFLQSEPQLDWMLLHTGHRLTEGGGGILNLRQWSSPASYQERPNETKGKIKK